MNEKSLIYKNYIKITFSIGSHGYNHYWWKKINKNEQEMEFFFEDFNELFKKMKSF